MAIVSGWATAPRCRTSSCRRSRAASFSMCWRGSSSCRSRRRYGSPRDSGGPERGLRRRRRLRRPSADDRVQLVDEEDRSGSSEFLDLGRRTGLQPLLEVAPVLCAGEKRTQVERPDADVDPSCPSGTSRRDDQAASAPFSDRRLADAGISRPISTWIDLRPAAEHLMTPRRESPRRARSRGRACPPRGHGLGAGRGSNFERLVGFLRGPARTTALPAAHLLDPGD